MLCLSVVQSFSFTRICTFKESANNSLFHSPGVQVTDGAQSLVGSVRYETPANRSCTLESLSIRLLCQESYRSCDRACCRLEQGPQNASCLCHGFSSRSARRRCFRPWKALKFTMSFFQGPATPKCVSVYDHLFSSRVFVLKFPQHV